MISPVALGDELLLDEKEPVERHLDAKVAAAIVSGKGATTLPRE